MTDLCVSLNGPHLDVMLPFFLESLYSKNDMDQVNLHLVDRGIAKPIRNFIEQTADRNNNVIIHEYPQTFKRRTRVDREPFDHIVADCAGVCSWMLENCGSEPIAIISHFDLDFTKPLVDHLIEQLDDDTGQSGSHGSGIVAYRREAVSQCHVGFDAISSFCVVKDQYQNWKVRGMDDPRCIDQDIPLHAFDVGELLEMALSGYGWRIYGPTDQWLSSWRNHLGTGSGHCGDLSQKRQQSLDILHQRGLSPIT